MSQTQARDSKGLFVKVNVPMNKGQKGLTSKITFTCKFYGEQKSIKQMEVARWYFPAAVACGDCYRYL